MLQQEKTESPDVPSPRRLAIEFRANLYRILASAFASPPSVDTVQALTGSDFADLLAGFLGEEATSDGGPPRELLPRTPCSHPRSESADGSVSGGSSTDLSLIRQEYFDLLAVPTDRYLTPFESVYCDQREFEGKNVRGLLHGPSSRRVERAYAASGLAVEAKELPDHIGCELGFMAELCAREAAALDSGDPAAADAAAETRRAFAAEHPARWVPRLCDRLGSTARTGFYRAVARITAAVVTDEAAAACEHGESCSCS